MPVSVNGHKQTVILLPTDNRPVTYVFPQLICQLANLNILVPPRQLMGSLFAPTDIGALSKWLKDAVNKISEGAILICVDSLLYGGLIPSRRGDETLKIILERAKDIVKLKELSKGHLKLYVQSSIMRISDNYDNSEEKLYWDKYGREIFHWSELLHKKEIGLLSSDIELKAAKAAISAEIRQDYLATRNRNFYVNETILDYAADGFIDYLIFSQDDSGKYGLNVWEKERLIQSAKNKNATNVKAYAGADEMLMTLIARYLNDQRIEPAKVSLHYSAKNGKNIASNYEGQTIEQSMLNQIDAQGLQILATGLNSSNVDFAVIAHTGEDRQGDHIWLPGLLDLRVVDTQTSAAKVIELIDQSSVPVVLCDIAYSNGADPVLISLLLKKPALLKKIWAYGGWNTTGNAVGSALAVGSACLHAFSTGQLDEDLRKKLLFVRLLDDWAYQTQVRKEIQTDKLAGKNRNIVLNKLMYEYANQIAQVIGLEPGKLSFDLPWQRTFEVEINLDPQFVTLLP